MHRGPYGGTTKRPDGNAACDNCGARIPFPTEPAASVSIDSTAGEPYVRVLTIDGIVVHRCIERGDRRCNAPRHNCLIEFLVRRS
jgi:hypothetical protein